MATQQHTASGYQGSGSNLVLSPKVSMLVMQQYKCQSPLDRMANWNGDPENNLVCNSKVYYETSQGLVSNEACDDTNGQVTLLHQSFASDFMELCGFEKYTLINQHNGKDSFLHYGLKILSPISITNNTQYHLDNKLKLTRIKRQETENNFDVFF